MGRICLGAAIILSVIGLGIYSLFTIKSQNHKLEIMLDNIAYLSENDQKDAAVQASKHLSDIWDDSYKKLYGFIDHKELAEIDDLIPRLTMLIEGDSDEIIAEVKTIKARLNRLYIENTPNYKNIF